MQSASFFPRLILYELLEVPRSHRLKIKLLVPTGRLRQKLKLRVILDHLKDFLVGKNLETGRIAAKKTTKPKAEAQVRLLDSLQRKEKK